MVFNTLKEIRNYKLEEIFTKKIAYNHNMYDYYLEKKLNKDSLEIFKEHYSTFKPTLDEISSFSKSKLTNVNELKKFVIEDLNNLMSRPFNKEDRQEFLCSNFVEPNFPNIPKLNEYKEILSKIGNPSESLARVSDYFRNTENILNIQKYLNDSKPYINKINGHPDYTTVENLIAHMFDKLNSQEINLIQYYLENHESFTLVTLEPYMIFVLGNALFFKFFLPIHKKGAFKYLINNAFLKQKILNNTFKKKFIFISQKFLSFIKKYPLLSSITSTSIGGLLYYNYKSPKIENLKSVTIVTDIAKNTILAGKGFNNKMIDSILNFSHKFAYTIGSSTGGLMISFTQGIFNKHSDIILKGTEKIDDILTKKKNK